MGYISTMVSRRAIRNPDEFLKKFYPLTEELRNAELKMMNIFNERDPIQAYQNAYHDYTAIIEKLKQIGI